MIDKNLVLYLSKLSKISVTEQEADTLVTEMDDVIQLMDMVKEAELPFLADPRPLLGYHDMDSLKQGEKTPRAQLLQNAKETSGGFFTVPKVIGK